MLEIKSPITGERLQVAENDFEKEMDWYRAKNVCCDLGNGWRLPTKSELELMCTEWHRTGKGNFKSATYWSSTDGGNDAWNLTFGFDHGSAYWDYYHKESTNYVRAVRAF